MTGIRLSTRTEISSNIANIYSCINENKAWGALDSLDALEMNIMVYFNTRGIACDRFIPLFAKTRNLLRRSFRLPKYKRQLTNSMLLINRELRASTMVGVEQGDPIKALRYIFDNLLDSYSEINLSGGQNTVQKNRELLDLIKNDLIELRELEPLFKERTGEFSALLQATNLCLAILPQVKAVTIPPASTKVFREYFQNIFNVISDIIVPVKPKPIVGELEKKTEDLGEGEKPLSKIGKDLDMDIEAMEKAAKESFYQGGKTNGKANTA